MFQLSLPPFHFVFGLALAAQVEADGVAYLGKSVCAYFLRNFGVARHDRVAENIAAKPISSSRQRKVNENFKISYTNQQLDTATRNDEVLLKLNVSLEL